MPTANLSCLRITALFVTAFCAFYVDELAKLRCCDVNFHNLEYVKITIASKTDVYMYPGMVLQFFRLGQVRSLVPSILYFLVIVILLL